MKKKEVPKKDNILKLYGEDGDLSQLYDSQENPFKEVLENEESRLQEKKSFHEAKYGNQPPKKKKIKKKKRKIKKNYA